MSIALLRQLPFEVRLSYCIIVAAKSFPDDSDHHKFFLELLNNIQHGYGEKDFTFFEQFAVSDDKESPSLVPDDDEYSFHKLGKIWTPDPNEEVITVNPPVTTNP